MRARVGEYPLSWRLGIAFFIAISIVTSIPAVIQHIEYYELYELQEQSIENISAGGLEHDSVLVMKLHPYSYPEGQRRIVVDKNLIGNAVGMNVTNMAPVMDSTKAPTTLFFAKEKEVRGDLNDGELVVVRWVWGLGGYRVKGIVALDAYNKNYANTLNILGGENDKNRTSRT